MNDLQAVRRQAERLARQGATAAADPSLLAGVETRDDPRQYDWDGRRRGGRADRPFFVFQYTLDGWGIYEDDAGARRVLPGHAFTAVIPGDHRYFLPADAPSWTFAFILIHHPYIVQRVQDAARSLGPVMAIAPSSPLVIQMLRLMEIAKSRESVDPLTREQAMFDFLFAYERQVRQQLHPQRQRQALLEATRNWVLQRINKPIEVDALASGYQMSRSHFSHHFKAVTGLSPARFITTVRLEQAMRRLANPDLKLQRIARECGFADANHFCKVFRRHYHMSPGAFRRQIALAPAPK